MSGSSSSPPGPFSRITFGDSPHFRPAWAADGRSLIYITDAGTGAGLPTLSKADGTGPPQTLLPSKFSFGQVLQSRDGRWIVLRRSLSEAGGGDIYGMKTGDTTLVPLLTTPAQETSPALSPDGRWLAYASDESGTSEVYVRPFPDVASGRWQVSLNGGTAPRWARSGRELFYVNGGQEMVAAPVRAGAGFEVDQPKVLFPAISYILSPSYPIYDVAADNRGFLMVRSAAATEETEVILTQNWFQELKARVGQ